MILEVKKMKRFSTPRSLILKALAIFAYLCFLLVSATLSAQEELTIATWGGSYEKAQQMALFEPFEMAKGIQVNTVRYSGGLDILKSDLLPDIIDMSLEDAVLACDQKLLQSIKK